MAVAMARARSLSSLRLAFNLPSRSLPSSSSAVILARRPSPAPPSPASWFTAIRRHSALVSESSSSISEKPPTSAMGPLFPGCDYEHWFVVLNKPGGEGATKQKMIDCCIQTLAKVVGSEEEAKKKIYSISCEKYFGFGCEIDEETSEKLESLPEVYFVLPDSYVDPEYKDYDGELFVNGEIVQRPPERQR
ncbi:Multiple organellar RNA editing factor 2, chloroplastic [Orobanche gracilis]